MASTFNKNVVGISLLFCAIVITLVLFEPQAIAMLYTAKRLIFQQFSWFYVLSSAFFIFLLLFLALSRYGEIKLGDDDEEQPEFSLGAWFSLLFTAGMGIGIIFLGVAEPLSHSLSSFSENAPNNEPQALFQSIFHWSINAWAIYGTIALAIGYFGFRYKLPLSLRSCFYPLFKQKINGRLGDLVDILGLCTTLFGILTTLAYSAIRLSSAFSSQINIQWILIAVFLSAILLATKSLANGLRKISELNLTISLLLMLAVLVLGPTAYLLSAFTENIGNYLSGVIRVGLQTYAYQSDKIGWFQEWTILYWAWWFSWAPAFGIFIARISKGRTIREFIFGVLIVPSLFFVLWFSIFGNGAIWVNEHLATYKLGDYLNQSGKLLFAFLDYFPYPNLFRYTTFAIILLFFIATVDFGIYILNNISSRDKSLVSPRWQAVMWGAILAGVTFILFQQGGIEALQATMLIFSLPFVLLMILMAVSLLKGLRLDLHIRQTDYQHHHWTEQNWRAELSTMLASHDKDASEHYLKHIALPALRELRQELVGIYDLSVHLETDFSLATTLKLTIERTENLAFYYKIERAKTDENYQLLAQSNLIEIPYDIQHFSQNELIADILQQYELYLQDFPH